MQTAEGPPTSGNSGEHLAEIISDHTTNLATLKQWMRQFVAERDWERFHNGKNLAMSLAIEAGELMEHFQWQTTDQVVAGQQLDTAGIGEELADVICYAVSLANALEIDIASTVAAKMVKNRLKYPAPGSIQ